MAVSPLNSSTTSAKALDPDSSRKGLICENTDANRVYILLASGTASATNFSFSLAQNENSGMIALGNYTGEVNAIWAGAGAGALMVTSW